LKSGRFSRKTEYAARIIVILFNMIVISLGLVFK
jgi:hypothetical protein